MRWRNFITMWGYPRMVAWTLLTALACALVRLPFAGLQMIPFVAEFHPGFVLVPAAGIFLGPAGAIGVMAGSLLGDGLTGSWGPMTTYRAVAHFLGALSARVLWQASVSEEDADDGAGRRPGAVRFMVAGLPAAFSVAAWHGLGADMARSYPFGYVATVVLINNVFFLALFAPAAFDVYVRHWLPAFGSWKTVMAHPAGQGRSTSGYASIWLGAVGSYVFAVLAGGWGCGDWPGQPVMLGSWTGWPARITSASFLILQAVGLMLAMADRPASEPEPPRYRFLQPIPPHTVRPHTRRRTGRRV